jgi:hypothetical protein
MSMAKSKKLQFRVPYHSSKEQRAGVDDRHG